MNDQITTRKIILCRGLPGSKKTSWARNMTMRHPGNMVSVSRDDLRKTLFGVEKLTGADKNREEDTITKIQLDTVRHMLMLGRSVIIDDMNLAEHTVERFYKLAQEFDGGVQLRFQDHALSIKECISNDLKRKESGGRYVGEKEIRAIAKRYMNGGSELPTLPVKYYSRIGYLPLLEQDKSLPPAWLVDIDGTIAHMNIGHGARSPYDHDRVDEDHPIEAIIDLVKVLHDAGYKIILVTGRDEVSRQLTELWLDYYGVPYDTLLMRGNDDQRSDMVIKAEIYEREIAGKYYVAGVLDDRKQVVDMWRSKGLKVAQVAPGLF